MVHWMHTYYIVMDSICVIWWFYIYATMELAYAIILDECPNIKFFGSMRCLRIAFMDR